MKLTARSILERLYGGVNSEDRLELMLQLTRTSSHAVFWRVFHKAWSRCDDTYHLKQELWEELEWRRHNGISSLNKAGRAFFAALPDPVTIYRGCSIDRVHGLSWTTDKQVAIGFARGHRCIRVPNPVVATATIRKEDIFTVIVDREESEVLVDTDGLSDVRVESFGTLAKQAA